MSERTRVTDQLVYSGMGTGRPSLSVHHVAGELTIADAFSGETLLRLTPLAAEQLSDQLEMHAGWARDEVDVIPDRSETVTYNEPAIQLPPDAAQVRPDPTVGDPPRSRVLGRNEVDAIEEAAELLALAQREGLKSCKATLSWENADQHDAICHVRKTEQALRALVRKHERVADIGEDK